MHLPPTWLPKGMAIIEKEMLRDGGEKRATAVKIYQLGLKDVRPSRNRSREAHGGKKMVRKLQKLIFFSIKITLK